MEKPGSEELTDKGKFLLPQVLEVRNTQGA